MGGMMTTALVHTWVDLFSGFPITQILIALQYMYTWECLEHGCIWRVSYAHTQANQLLI